MSTLSGARSARRRVNVTGIGERDAVRAEINERDVVRAEIGERYVVRAEIDERDASTLSGARSARRRVNVTGIGERDAVRAEINERDVVREDIGDRDIYNNRNGDSDVVRAMQ